MHANRWFAWATAVLTCGLIIAMAVIGERPLAAQAAAPPAAGAGPAAPRPEGVSLPPLPPPVSGARQAGPAPSQAPAPAAAAGDYVGEETCQGCHDQSYKGTKHALAFNDRTPAATH